MSEIFYLQGLAYENIQRLNDAKKCFDFVMNYENGKGDYINIPDIDGIQGGSVSVQKNGYFISSKLPRMIHIGMFYCYKLHH